MTSVTPDYLSLCLACGGTITPTLVRAASTRCADCRDADAPLRAQFVERRLLLHQRSR